MLFMGLLVILFIFEERKKERKKERKERKKERGRRHKERKWKTT